MIDITGEMVYSYSRRQCRWKDCKAVGLNNMIKSLNNLRGDGLE